MIISIIAFLLSTVTAIWTLVYSHRQTRAAARANALTEKAQREQAEPYVIVDIRPRVPGSSLFVLVIENIGPTIARDVRITVDPPLQTSRGEEKAQILNRAVDRKIATLPPKRRISFVMDTGPGLFGSDLPKVYNFRVESSGPFGPVEPLAYTVDLDVVRESVLETESVEWSAHQLAEQAKKSVAAQGRQASAMEELVDQVQRSIELRQGAQNEEGGGAAGDPDSSLLQIPMDPLGD